MCVDRLRRCSLNRDLPRNANAKVALFDLDIGEVRLVQDFRKIADHDLVDPGVSASHAFSSPLFLFGGLRYCDAASLMSARRPIT